jgi:glycosyltransferase involved in cell wall biosynthesis
MAQRLEQSFEQLFAPRRAVFKQALQRYRATLPAWQAVMSHYDAVIGYATDGIYPLLAGMRPYVAFEHGTIRSIPFVDDADGQLCALTYRMADGVIITNADNITAARKLGLATYRFVPHPVNDEPMADECARAGYEKLHADLGSDFVVFHPARQHWEEQRHPNWEKGNDIFLKGFAAFVKTVNPRASAVLVNWGASVPESRALIDALGIASRVRWVEPLPHREMMRMIRACDAVADQFFLGAFGSTTPKALACAKPVLLRLDVEAHRWCFPDPPPVVNARDEREVLSGLDRLYRDPGHYQEVCRLGQRWYERWHSSEVVTGRLNDIVREVIQHG